ncbi:hypothetical protein GCM10020000_64930 [Streptomyces olivoverticillatus]
MYDFELDPFQIEACRALEAGKGVLVAAPTGSGKTIVGEFAVHLALTQGRKCFYTTPIKALSNQKYNDLVRRYGAAKVGLLTGDNSVNADAPVLVMTTEVLRNMLYAGSQALNGLGHVVMDEVHYLSDRFRGAVWEEVIIHLPESVTLVSLSATVSNAEEFGDWLDTVRGDTEVIVSEHRPVPLWQHVLAGRRMYDLFEEKDTPDGRPGSARREVNPDLVRLARMENSRPMGGRDRRRGRNLREADRERERRQRSRIWTPSRVEVIERLDAEGLLLYHHLHLQPRRLRGRRPAVPLRGPAAQRRRGPRPRPLDRRGALRRHPRRRPARPGLLRVAGGPGAGHRRPPRGHAADLQGGRRGAVRQGPGQGRLRHRDPGAGHQHARPLGRAGEAGEVERRTACRHHPPASTPSSPGAPGGAASTSRAMRWCCGSAPWIRERSRASPAPARIRCAPASSPRTTWPSTWSRSSARHRSRELLETSFAQFQADKSVVGISRQVQKNEEGLAGYREAITCHLGDFDEYARLRRELKDRETELAKQGAVQRRAAAATALERLKPGDVIHVPTGKYAGLALVLDPGLPAGRTDRHRGFEHHDGPRPLVLTAERQVKRLAAIDFPVPVEPLERMRIPKSFNPRSPPVPPRPRLRAAHQGRAPRAGAAPQVPCGRRGRHRYRPAADRDPCASLPWLRRARGPRPLGRALPPSAARHPPAGAAHRGAYEHHRAHLRPHLRAPVRPGLPARRPGDGGRPPAGPALRRAGPAGLRVPARGRLGRPQARGACGLCLGAGLRVAGGRRRGGPEAADGPGQGGAGRDGPHLGAGWTPWRSSTRSTRRRAWGSGSRTSASPGPPSAGPPGTAWTRCCGKSRCPRATSSAGPSS